MKKALLTMLILTALTLPALAVDNPWKVKLPYKSGLITYKLSGSMKGKKALYFKDYGRIRAEYSKVQVSMMGMTNTESTTKITTPDWVYTIDNTSKVATKEINPNKFMIEEFEKLSKQDQQKVADNVNKAGKITAEGLQGKIEKNAATILGCKCDKVEIMGTELYLISGTDIPLKTVGNTMGIKIKEIASSIKKGTPPAKAFKLPKMRYETDPDSEALMRDQARSIVRGLIAGPSTNALTFEEDEDEFFSDEEFPFDEEMTDEQAIMFRKMQGMNSTGYDDDDQDDDSSFDEAETARDVKKGLTKMFKNMF